MPIDCSDGNHPEVRGGLDEWPVCLTCGMVLDLIEVKRVEAIHIANILDAREVTNEAEAG